MTLDGAKYILALAHIKAGVERLQTKFSHTDEIVPEEEQKRELKLLVDTHIGEWQTKVPKMASVTNPEYKGFFEKCVELYNWCEKTRKEGHLKDDAVNKGVQCGLNKCQVYASGTVSNALCCNLLEASVKRKLREVYHHPSKLAEQDIKAWIGRHGMLESVMELATCAMDGIFDEILVSVPDSRLPGAEVTELSLRELIQIDLQKYKDTVFAKFFPIIWKEAKPDLVTLRKRAKRLVYQFFMEMEGKDRTYFWVYPLCFDLWVRSDSQYLMYPGEGSDPPRDMTPWELINCPWYIESDMWATPANPLEVSNLRAIEKGCLPASIRAEAKV
ncbi:unnamed protein product [Calypogeia fissa]